MSNVTAETGTPIPTLGESLVEMMDQLTQARTSAHGFENAVRHESIIKSGQSLSKLRTCPIGQGDHALVIAAGPSQRRFDTVSEIKRAAYKGAIVATESSLLMCLRNNIRPDLVVSLDPHATRIVRWYGDPHLNAETLSKDDYFSRQDMDPAFSDELKANEEILKLLDRHGKGMRIALSTSASAKVVQRVQEIGMDVFWWNPMYDDPEQPDSISRRLFEKNRKPIVNAGGNVGTACWVLAHEVLNKRRIGLTGVDFSYYEGTPFRATQYYAEACEIFGEERLNEFFIRIFNPHVEKWFFTDPAYMWYRSAFLQLAREADVETYNCTGGGILFEDPVHVESLSTFLERTAA